jgi:V/A-type H+-transporting ATPase subunit A
MKYTIPNDDLSGIDKLKDEIDQYFDVLFKKYEN